VTILYCLPSLGLSSGHSIMSSLTRCLQWPFCNVFPHLVPPVAIL
jgi:hypothetical protein